MKKITILCITIVFISVFNGCRKDEFITGELPELSLQQQREFTFKDGQMILGEKLENPYSFENMTKAYDNLVEKNELKSKIKIETTHFYVRFRPKSFQELDLLTRDTSLHIYDYPLDVEIKRGGTHYHDPSIPANQITWQYTVVPVDYVFPDIQYQKLADLFLREETGELEELKSGSMDYFDWITLETEALRITGNLVENETNEVELKSTSWRPSGTIRVFDDVINSYSTTIRVFDHYEYYNCETGEPINDPYPAPYLKSIQPPDVDVCSRAVYRYETSTTNSHFIPLEGVEVRANRWFTTHTGFVDANGNFTCNGTFSGDANYSIKWERYNYSIREEDWGQAYFNGPKMSGEWNLFIDSEKSLRYATIHRAAFLYYYKNIDGLKKPPLNDWYKRQLKIGYYHRKATSEINGDANPYWPQWYTWPDLRIFGENSNGWRNTRDIFSTTIHELAHASHWDLSGNTTFIATESKVAESWARGVQWYLTRMVYTNYRGGPTIRPSYTQLVVDLVDSRTDDFTNNGTNFPNDQVANYTMKEIEDALKEQKTWDGWRDNIKNKYNNETENNVDALFTFWN